MTTCPAGKIRRKGYTTKRGVHVTASCVPDRGRPGKGPKILPKPRKGALKGYRADMPARSRRAILDKIARKDGCGEVARRLNLVANFNKRQAPVAARIMRSDISYLKGASSVCRRQCKVGDYTGCE